ncbi:FmdB family zinc ribbon protein [Saccharothrix syringae]|uniref:FmdB family transcriptional regulator n=1 Tax=Saccharothrix syringae TaxID=103733 RepID=A0A5Q0GRL8_SACSY|nr:FmdB family zinc ribbon protein [Saccharothrix syringae]QFZ16619.1 FmdB family transcriptional regulator [Saccharothrix syringae]
MPTYQYACTECDHRFEAVQSFSDSALTECPQCSGRLRKLYGAVGVVFKGSGFYRTDSRAGSSSAKSESSSSSSTSSKSESSSKSGSSSSSSPSSSAPAAAAS